MPDDLPVCDDNDVLCVHLMLPMHVNLCAQRVDLFRANLIALAKLFGPEILLEPIARSTSPDDA